MTDLTQTARELPELPDYAASLHVQYYRNAPSMRNTDFVETADFPQGCHRLYSEDQMRAYALAAVESAPARAVPEGFVLVPREPTPEMLRAGFLSESEGFDIETPADAPGLVYRAMLAAAPSTPTPSPQSSNPKAQSSELAALSSESAPPAMGEVVEMSPEFTDSARGAIAWVLYHHQGGSSPVGQPLRFALGMDTHERLSDEQVRMAKMYAELTGRTTDDFHKARTTPQPQAAAGGVDLEQFRDVVNHYLGYYRGSLRLAEDSLSPITCGANDLFQRRIDKATRLLALIDATPTQPGAREGVPDGR